MSAITNLPLPGACDADPSGETMRSPDSISCVVPSLNEEANLRVLLPMLLAVLRPLAPCREIIVVDDGSTDATPELCAEWANIHPEIVYLCLSRNFGKEAALSAGIEASRGDVVVCLDADLQHPPAFIAQMLERWRRGVDMVYAVRQNRGDEPLFKRIGTRLFYGLMRTSDGVHVPRDAGDFRLMDRRVVDALCMLPERDRFMKGLFAWVGFQSEPFYYTPSKRIHGATAFKASKLMHFAFDGLTAFTTWPLRMLSITGVSLSLLSFSYGLFVVVKHWLYGDPVQGWATLIAVILFFSGVNLASLGVVGEYVGRIFSEVKRRPAYLLKERLGEGLARTSVGTAASAKRDRESNL